MHWSIGANLTFNGLNHPFHSELAFSKATVSIYISLTSGYDTLLFKAEVNLYKKIVKASFGPCITLVFDTDLFSDSSALSQVFKTAKKKSYHKGVIIKFKLTLYLSILTFN